MILSAEQLQQATGGILHHAAASGRLTTDTRQIKGAEWFVPLIGARFDAHDFLDKAAELGCLGTIASRVPEGWNRGWIEVPDTLDALQDIARFIRNQFEGTVVGITGSAGKTTLRVMILEIAKQLGQAHGTSGNFNNHIGLPLTLLASEPTDQYWILEMGMNHLGEIDLLQSIARPHIRIITNVGAAHTEGVGSIEGVAEAKSELFAGAQKGDILCINLDDAYIPKMTVPAGVRTITYGHAPEADITIQRAEVNPKTLSCTAHIAWPTGETFELSVPSPAIHMAHNAVAAAAVGYAMGAEPAQIQAALKAYIPTGARLKLRQFERDILIIDDAYNANPLSMRASIDLMVNFEGRRILCLGDMLELGTEEIQIHHELLRHALSIDNVSIFTVGPRFMKAAEGLKGIHAVQASSELGNQLTAYLRDGDRVLLKGSRGIRMENALQQLALQEIQ